MKLTAESESRSNSSQQEDLDRQRQVLSASCRLPSEILSQIYFVASTSTRFISTLLKLESSTNIALKPILYTRVILESDHQLSLFKRTIFENHDSISSSSEQSPFHLNLCQLIKSLYISNSSNPSPTESSSTNPEISDRLLQLLPSITHLVLNLDSTYSPSNGLYMMKNLRQLTLINLKSPVILDGLIKKQKEMVEEIREKQQVLLKLGMKNRKIQNSDEGLNNGFNGNRINRIHRLSEEIYGGYLPLKRLELVSFPGQLLTPLSNLTSLTHLVLTKPIPPQRHSSANGQLLPGLRILPRSSISFLLGSKRLKRIIIRTTLVPLERIMEELKPIEDERLRFRILGDDSSIWKSVSIGSGGGKSSNESGSSSGNGNGVEEDEELRESLMKVFKTESRNRLPTLDLKDEFKQAIKREESRRVRIEKYRNDRLHFETERRLSKVDIRGDDESISSSRDMDVDEEEHTSGEVDDLELDEVDDSLSPWNTDEDESSMDQDKVTNENPSTSGRSVKEAPFSSHPSSSFSKPDRLYLPPPFADEEGDVCGATEDSCLKMIREYTRRNGGGGVRVEQVNGLAFW